MTNFAKSMDFRTSPRPKRLKTFLTRAFCFFALLSLPSCFLFGATEYAFTCDGKDIEIYKAGRVYQSMTVDGQIWPTTLSYFDDMPRNDVPVIFTAQNGDQSISIRLSSLDFVHPDRKDAGTNTFLLGILVEQLLPDGTAINCGYARVRSG